MRHSEPLYFFTPHKTKKNKTVFKNVVLFSRRAPGPILTPTQSQREFHVFSCRLSRWDVTDRSSFHTLIGRVGKSEKFKSSGISSLRFHNQARFNIRSHLFVCLFIYLFIFGCAEKLWKKIACVADFLPVIACFSLCLFSTQRVSASVRAGARVCVCVTAGCAAAKGRSLTICKLLFFQRVGAAPRLRSLCGGSRSAVMSLSAFGDRARCAPWVTNSILGAV